MPSLSNYNTRSKMALDIPLCRANKGQKSMLFLGAKIWNMLSSNMKAVQLQLLSHTAWKKKFLKKCNSEQFYWFLLTVDFFFLQENPNRNKNRFRYFLCHPCLFRSRNFFFFFFFFLVFASDLAKYFNM